MEFRDNNGVGSSSSSSACPGRRRGRRRVLSGQPGATSRPARRTLQKIPIVVAVRAIPARQAIVAEDVAVRDVPLDPTNANGVVTDPDQVIGRIPAVTILQNQPVTQNMLASSQAGDEFSILGPDESVGPDSEAWRAVSITVPDDLAVGGVPQGRRDGRRLRDRGRPGPAGHRATGQLHDGPLDEDRLPERPDPRPQGPVLHHQGAARGWPRSSPISRRSGTATMSMVLRPETSTSARSTPPRLGETTNRIIQKYGLPIPENYPRGNGPLPASRRSPPPTPFPSPAGRRLRQPGGRPTRRTARPSAVAGRPAPVIALDAPPGTATSCCHRYE